jgi:hypothetical protein
MSISRCCRPRHAPVRSSLLKRDLEDFDRAVPSCAGGFQPYNSADVPRLFCKPTQTKRPLSARAVTLACLVVEELQRLNGRRQVSRTRPARRVPGALVVRAWAMRARPFPTTSRPTPLAGPRRSVALSWTESAPPARGDLIHLLSVPVAGAASTTAAVSLVPAAATLSLVYLTIDDQGGHRVVVGPRWLRGGGPKAGPQARR